MPGFRLASLDVHGQLLSVARDEAQQIMAADPDLTSDHGKALRILLHLFEREEAVKLLRAG
jgi:ATP-dependent DNA helicase RecG